MAFAEAEVVPALSQLKQGAPLIAEAALLSTCNRVELVAVSTESARAAEELRGFLALERRVEANAFESALYHLEGREAVRHLFRVGASLDSMVLGEPQILGQLKIAYAQAVRAGTLGMILHRTFHRAFSVAKRVRKGTLIGHGAVSVSSAAVGLAREIFDTLKDKTVMLLGAGQMAELTARQLVKLGVQSLLIVNRTFERAAALARELGGTAVTFDNYKPYLKIADVLIGSVATARPLLGPEDIEPILRERRYRPMFLIDLGVPRNFHERLSTLDNVYLYDIDDLGTAVTNSRAEREREAEKAEAFVAEEVEGVLALAGRAGTGADHQGHPLQHGSPARGRVRAPSRMARHSATGRTRPHRIAHARHRQQDPPSGHERAQTRQRLRQRCLRG